MTNQALDEVAEVPGVMTLGDDLFTYLAKEPGTNSSTVACSPSNIV